MLVHKAYRYRIYPTKEQILRLLQWEGALRFLWNLAQEQRLLGLARCRGEKRYYTAFDQINELTDLRKEVPWLAEVPRNVSNQVLVELDKAWQRCFTKLAKQPRFKRRGRDTLSLTEPHPKLFRLEGTVLTFPKLGEIRAVVHRTMEGKAKTCTISREVDQWFASVMTEQEATPEEPSTKPAVALDRGVVCLTADSNDILIDNPAFGEHAAKRLARAQRQAARKQKGSANQKKAQDKVAKIHRLVRRQREHFLHVLTHLYAKNHGVVVIEDLKIGNMTRSAAGTVEEPGSMVAQKAGLNRAILDAGWGRTEQMLAQKLPRFGGRLEKVRAAYSSQECSACHHVDAASRVSRGWFCCTQCKHAEHADTNAAKVLLSRRVVGGAVCGGDGYLRPTKQKLRVARRGSSSRKTGPQSLALQDED